MAYPMNYSYPTYPQFQPQVPAPMDRLAQLQAQQMQPQQYPSQMTQPQPTQSWAYVQGEAAAKSWMIANGQSVLLMDSENPVFYIKSADASGIPLPLRVFDYKERTQNIPQNAPQSTQSAQTNLDDKYVTREEYGRLQAQYAEIMNKLEGFRVSAMASDDTRKPASAPIKPRNKGGNSDEQSSI